MKFGVILTINFLAVHGVRHSLVDHHRAVNLHKFFKVQKGKWGTTNPVPSSFPPCFLTPRVIFGLGHFCRKITLPMAFSTVPKKRPNQTPTLNSPFFGVKFYVIYACHYWEQERKWDYWPKRYELFGFIYSRDKMFCFY